MMAVLSLQHKKIYFLLNNMCCEPSSVRPNCGGEQGFSKVYTW